MTTKTQPAETQQQPISFGSWLHKHRKRRGWTLEELGAKVKRSKSYISSLERDESHSIHGHAPRPTPETVDMIAKAFEVDPAEPRLMLGYAPRSYDVEGSPVVIAESGTQLLQMIHSDSQRVDLAGTIKMLNDDAERYEQAARSLRELAASLEQLRK